MDISYSFISLRTIVSVIFASYGLLFNKILYLLVSTILGPTSEIYYTIIHTYIYKKTISFQSLLIYICISILLPLLLSILIGYIFTHIKKNNDKVIYDIPSDYMLERTEYHPINLIFKIISPFIIGLFLHYSIINNNVKLIIAISITLSLIIPLVDIGMILGNNIYNKEHINFKNYYIPLITFICNISAVILVSIFTIKIKKK